MTWSTLLLSKLMLNPRERNKQPTKYEKIDGSIHGKARSEMLVPNQTSNVAKEYKYLNPI